MLSGLLAMETRSASVDTADTSSVDPESGTCWGCGAAPAEGRRFQRCAKCIEQKLTPCAFCSKQCLKAHWPRHKAWHKEQVNVAALHSASNVFENADLAERLKVATASKGRGNGYGDILGTAFAAMGERNYKHAIKFFKKAVTLQPGECETALSGLGDAYKFSNDHSNAASCYLMALDQVWDVDDSHWPHLFGSAFNSLLLALDVPRPAWWNDQDLLRLSERAARLMPSLSGIWDARAQVLSGQYVEALEPTKRRVSERVTGEQLREAALCFEREAENSLYATESCRQNADRCRQLASMYDSAIILDSMYGKN